MRRPSFASVDALKRGYATDGCMDITAVKRVALPAGAFDRPSRRSGTFTIEPTACSRSARHCSDRRAVPMPPAISTGGDMPTHPFASVTRTV
ncbi:MAG: hypothetical protein IPP94_15350 [Ignavibacteria bacterium]|nr:hypothetical protein [Ignavibacteria bacterium]